MAPPDAVCAVRPLAAADLPAVQPAVAQALAVLCGRLAPGTVRVAGAELGVAWCGPDPGDAGAPSVDLAVRIGASRYRLGLCADGALFPMGIDFARLSPVAARTLAAELCEDAIRAIEHGCGLPVTLNGVWDATGPWPLPGLSLRLHDTGSGRQARAVLAPQDGGGFDLLLRLCAGWPRLQAAGDPPWRVRCRFFLGRTALRRGEWAQLVPGDLLFIERRIAVDGGGLGAAMALGVGRAVTFRVRLEEDEVDIMDGGIGDEGFGSEDAGWDGGEAPSRWSDLEFTVRFWLGGRRLGWDELRALRPGSVIALGQPVAEAEVRLEVEGQCIGRGTLVSVGDQLGVRLTQVAPPELAGDRSTNLP